MKKIMMFAAIAAAALSSCSNSELVDVSSGRAIGFETFVGKASTKGVPVSGTKFDDGATIKVWGFTTDAKMGETLENQTEIPGLKETVVTKSGSSWSYSPVAYWKDGKAHTFFACAPGEASPTFTDGAFTYTVEKNVADQVDFMVADALKNEPWASATMETPPTQSFVFRHALSQIKYSVGLTMAADDVAKDVKVKSITIECMGQTDPDNPVNFVNSGTINVVGRTDANADLEWTNPTASGNTASYVVTPATPVALGTTVEPVEYKEVVEGADNILMLLPQTTEGNVRFTVAVEYTKVPEPTDGSSLTGEGSATFVTTAAQTWAPNKIYHYKFGISMPQVLKQKPIIFDDNNMEIKIWDATEKVFNEQGEAVTPAP